MEMITIIIGGVFIFILNIFFIKSLVYNLYISYFSNYIEIEGEVIECKTIRDYDIDSKVSIKYECLISYKIGNKIYCLELSTNRKMQKGKKVPIMYNPDNPSESVRKNDPDEWKGLLFGIILIVAFWLVLKY